MLAASMSEFVPIKKNRYLERPKQVLMPKDYASLQCSCKPAQNKALVVDSSRTRQVQNSNTDQSYDCGDLCLNRSVNQDCIPQVCPVGNACRNRKFTLHQNAYVYPVKTQSKGWGLSAGEKIQSGQFVMQYVGEVFYEDSPIGEQRIEKYKNSTCTYMMKTENGEVIDPTFYGNIARFINHSCDPNCVTRKWTVERETMIGIFAIRDIQEDEELSFDYQFDSFKTPYTKCYCGSYNCKGYLGLGLYEDIKDNKNAPQCKICSKLVEKEHHLVVCRGGCRGVYHKKCLAKSDPLVRDPDFQRNNYICKVCEKDRRKKKLKVAQSPQKTGQNEQLTDEQPMEESQKSHVAEFPALTDPYCLEFASSSSQNQLLDKIIEREIYQIDLAQKNTYINYCPGSIAPLVPKDTPLGSDNQINTPKIEDQLEDEFKLDGIETTPALGKKKAKKRLQISAFYSFHYELCRRLKLRMKENRGTFKFRKVYSQVRGNSTTAKNKDDVRGATDQKQIRNKSSQKILKKVPDLLVYSEPKKDQIESKASDQKTKSQREIVKEKQSQKPRELALEQQITESLPQPIQEKQDSVLSTARVLTGRMKRLSRITSLRQASVTKTPSVSIQTDPTKGQEQTTQSPTKVQIKVPILSQSNLTPVKNRQVDQQMKEDCQSSKLSSKALDDELSVDGEQDTLEEEEELDLCDETSSSDDEQESQEAESSEEDFAEQRKGNSLLQDQESVIVETEKQSAKKISKYAKKAAIKAGINPSQLEILAKTKLTSQQEKDMQSLDESLLQKKRGRPSKSDLQIRHLLQVKLARQIVKEKGSFQVSGKDAMQDTIKSLQDYTQNEMPFRVTRDRKHSGNGAMNLMSSLQARREKTLRDIELEIESKVQKFVDQEVEKEEKVLEGGGKIGETRTTKFNVYKILFDLVIGRNIELFQCVQSLELTWDNAWADLVTLKIGSTLQQFNGFLEILQTAIDLLLFGKLLTIPIGQQTQSLMRRLNEGESASSVMPFFIMTIHVPKVFLKKLVGYQEKVLVALKQDFEVDFVYDETLVTDIVYAPNETTPVRIFGKGRDVVKVCCQLQLQLEKLQIKTLYFTKEESKFILLNIKEIKVKVNPCEIRVRLHNQMNQAKPTKDDEIKHPIFCSIHTTRDVCLIGTEQEIGAAENLLWEFFSTKPDAPNTNKVQVCFLLPIQMRNDIYDIQQKVQGDFPDVYIRHFLPQYPRKHITLSVHGPWRTLLLVDRSLASKTDSKFRSLNQPAYRNFAEFQEFAWHTQLRQNLKNLMRIELDNQTAFLTHWDTTSSEIERAIIRSSPPQSAQNEDQNLKFILSTDMKQEILRAMNKNQENFDQNQVANPTQEQIIAYFNRLQIQKEQRLVNYLCQIDQESCLNALFALSDLENQTLEKLFKGLSLPKKNFVRMCEQTISTVLRKLNCPSYFTYEQGQISQAARIKASQIQREDQQTNRSKRDQSVNSASQRNNNDDSRILNENSPSKSYLQSNVTEKESASRKRSRSRSRSRSTGQIEKDQIINEDPPIQVEQAKTVEKENNSQRSPEKEKNPQESSQKEFTPQINEKIKGKDKDLIPKKQQSMVVRKSSIAESGLEEIKVENLSERGVQDKETPKEDKQIEKKVQESSKNSVIDSQNPLGKLPLIIRRSSRAKEQKSVKEDVIPASSDLPKDAADVVSIQGSDAMPAEIMTQINAPQSPVSNAGLHLQSHQFEQPQISRKRLRSRSRERSTERDSSSVLNGRERLQSESRQISKEFANKEIVAPESTPYLQSQSRLTDKNSSKNTSEVEQGQLDQNDSARKQDQNRQSASQLASGQGFYQTSQPRPSDQNFDSRGRNSYQNHHRGGNRGYYASGDRSRNRGDYQRSSQSNKNYTQQYQQQSRSGNRGGERGGNNYRNWRRD